MSAQGECLESVKCVCLLRKASYCTGVRWRGHGTPLSNINGCMICDEASLQKVLYTWEGRANIFSNNELCVCVCMVFYRCFLPTDPTSQGKLRSRANPAGIIISI